MDYSYVPQLYQQGAQHGLGMQMQMAAQAQPVTQFLAALRQGQQDRLLRENMDRQNQLADIQQQKADAAEQHQNALEKLSFMTHTSSELTPQNSDQYRALSNDLFGQDLVAPDKVSVQPEVPALDYGPDQGKVNLDGKSFDLTPQSSGGIKSFTDIIKPTGSKYQQTADANQAKLQARRYAQDVKVQIAEMQNDTKQDSLDIRRERVGSQNQLDQAKIDKANAEVDKIQSELDAGLIDARTAKYRADAALAYAKGAYVEGPQTAHTTALAENVGKPTVTITTGGGLPPRVVTKTPGGAAPAAPGLKQLPPDRLAQYNALPAANKAAVAAKLRQLGYQVPNG